MSTLQTIGTVGLLLIFGVVLLVIVGTVVSWVVEEHQQGSHDLLKTIVFMFAAITVFTLLAAMSKGYLG